MESKTSFDRGEALYKQGDKDGAIAQFTEALRLNPQFGDAYIGRGIVRRAKGDLSGAMADYDEGLRLNPSVRGFVSRGIAKRANNDLDGAIRDYSEALRLNPNDATALNNRGYTRYEKGDYIGAIADCDEAIRINPKQSYFYYSRGAAYAAGGNTSLAKEDFQQALKLNPNHPKAQQMKAKIAEWGSAVANPTATPISASSTITAMPDFLPTPSPSNQTASMFQPATASRTDSSSNLFLGIVGGTAGAAVGAVIWAAITAVTHIKFGLVAIGIGFLVALGVQSFGKGNDVRFGAAGAMLSFLGCLLGNILVVFILVSVQNPKLAVPLATRPDIILKAMGSNLSLFDVVFYGIALYEGFRFSMRPMKR